jgi:uncharacterized protein with HEPN domain
VHGINRAAFDEDIMRQAAVIRMVEVIGEAASKLSAEFRERQSHVPWRDIITMRNFLIHAYGDVDLDEVWQVVDQDLDELLKAIVPLLPESP